MTQKQEKRFRIAEAPPGFKRPGAKEPRLHFWITEKISEYKTKILSDSTLNSNQADALIIKFSVAINHMRLGGFATRRLDALAYQLGKSYALVRKWRADKSFLKLIDQLAAEFMDGFLIEYTRLIELLFTAIDEADENPVVQKHLAETAHLLSEYLLMANNDWGLILYKEAHNRIPALIRKQKDSRIQGPLYALLLLCCIRSKDKLNLPKTEATKYKRIFQDFMSRLGWQARLEAEKGRAFQSLFYMDMFMGFAWLFHEKLIERYLPDDIGTIPPSVIRGYDNRNLEKMDKERSV